MSPRGRAAMNLIREVTEEIFRENMQILLAASKWADLDLGAKEPPESWVRELGKAEAEKVFRVAICAQMPSKDAPIGLKMAGTIVTGILNTYERHNKGGQDMRADAAVEMTVDAFPEQEVDD